jgi:hypothetical protein
VSAEVRVDNCKTAVRSHPLGPPALFHPRYRDFAQHYSFTIKACGAASRTKTGTSSKPSTT